jgi:O-antigen/teichoic acid export membrane protein
VVNLAMGITTGIVAARWLGPEQRGELAVFVAGSFMLSTIFGMCSHESLPFLIRSKLPAGAVIGTAVAAQVVLGLVAALVSLGAPMVDLVPAEVVRSLTRVQPWFAVACVAYATNNALLSGIIARSGATSFMQVEGVRQATYLIFLILLVVGLRWGLEGALTAFTVALAAQLTASMLLLRQTTRGLRWDTSLAGRQFRYGARALPGRIAEYLFTGGGDVLVMSLATSPVGVGHYVVARAVTNLSLMPAVSTGLVVQGPAGPGHTGSPRTKHLLVAAATLTFSAAAVLGLAGPTLIRFVYGEQFVAAGTLLRWLLAAVPALLLGKVLSAWNAREGFPHRNSISVGIGAVLLVAIVPTAGRLWGTIAAVAAMAVAIWFQCGILVVLHLRGRRHP